MDIARLEWVIQEKGDCQKGSESVSRRVTVILIGLIAISAAMTDEAVTLNGGSRDYCYYETFEAFCADREVILMVKALYGRMQFGRCVKTNFGFIGCYTSVLDLLDRKCSGRQSCSVEVIEPTFDSIRPCNMELKSYLEAEYRCIKVATSNMDASCDVIFDRERTTVAVTNHDVDSCGTDQRPWQMRVDSGQRLNVSLFQFSAYPLVGDGQEAYLEDAVTPGIPHRDCHVIGQFAEVQLKRRFSLCSSPNDARESHVYVSLSNLVDVTLNPSHEDRYILVFTVIGCADIDLGPNVWVRYSVDRMTAEVGCRHGTQSWQLLCRGQEWLGHHDNCSLPVASQPSTLFLHPNSIFRMNSVLVALIVVLVSAAISFCVLLTGLFVFKKLNGQGLRSSGPRRHLLNVFGGRYPSSSAHPSVTPDDAGQSDSLSDQQHRSSPCCPHPSISRARHSPYGWTPGRSIASHNITPCAGKGDPTEHDLFVLKDNAANDGVDLFALKGELFTPGVTSSPRGITGCPECLAVGHPVRWDVDGGIGATDCQEVL